MKLLIRLGKPTHFNVRPTVLCGWAACGCGSDNYTHHRQDVNCLSCRRTKAFRKRK